MTLKLRAYALWLAAACLGTACTARAAESALIDPAPLADLDAEIAAGKHPLVDSLLVMRCGEIVFDRRYAHDYAKIYFKEAHEKGPLNAHLTGPYNYFDPAWHPYFKGTDEHSMQSVSKTVTSVLIGIAVTRGDFKAPLSTPVLHYFDESRIKNLDDRKRRMTLQNILTMTSGLDWNEEVAYDDPANPSDLMEATDDWVQFVIDRPMLNEPGSTYAYSSGATELFAFIFKRETGIDIEEYAKRYLFGPLGIRNYHWKRTPLGVVDTEGGLFLRSEDLAKIGLLYLRDGVWDGKRLVSSNWIRESVTPRISAGNEGFGEHFQYGYYWWLLPYDSPAKMAWVARGFGGQRLIVFPEENLIVVSTAWHILQDESIEFDIVRRLLPALRSHECPKPVEETIGTVRQMYDGALTPDLAVSTFRHIDRLFPTRTVAHSDHVLPLPPADRPLTMLKFASRGKQWDLVDYLAVNRVAGLLVLKDGRIAFEAYQYGNTPQTRWMSMSIAKSITSTLIGAAIQQGKIASIDDPVTKYVPALLGSAYQGVSIRDILLMSSGVRWNEAYTDPSSDRRRLLEVQIAGQPGAAIELMRKLPRAAPPGTVNNYNTGETLVAGEVVHAAVKRTLCDYLGERIWRPFGMESDATWWLASADGMEIAGSGFSATLRDYGRFGLFFLGGGRIGDEQVLPPGWSEEAGSPKELKNGRKLDYGFFWWPATATPETPDAEGAYLAEGIFGQYLYLNPRERLVIVVWSAQSKPEGMDIIDNLDFFGAVSAALH